jgi:GTPase SAR1 family protein
MHGEFLEEDDCPTVEDSHSKTISIDGNEEELIILDTGGGGTEFYENLHEKWFKSSEGFILVYNITSQYTFSLINSYIRQILNVKQQPAIPIVIAGTFCKFYIELIYLLVFYLYILFSGTSRKSRSQYK